MLKPIECSNCILYNIGNSFSVPEGNGTLGVTMIGEGLGHDEAIDGKPFRPRAQAGSLLEKCIKQLGYSRNQFRLWNLIGCQPPGNKLNGANFEQRAIEYCREAHFNHIVPRNGKNVILALGNLPLKYLTGASGLAKEKQSISFLQGFVLRSPYGLVVPAFHPSYLRRGATKYTDVLRMAITRAVDIARGDFIHAHHSDYKPPEFITTPSIDDFVSFAYRCRDNINLPLAVDIETPHSRDKDSGESSKYATAERDEFEDDEEEEEEQIIIEVDSNQSSGQSGDEYIITKTGKRRKKPKKANSGRTSEESNKKISKVAIWKQQLNAPIISIQFSLGSNEGIFVPWKEPYIKVIMALLQLNQVKLGWNIWDFDLPRLKAKGANLNGQVIDLMWKWHHFQPDLDRNLQFAASYCGWPYPWKHLFGGPKMSWYGCTDVAVLHFIDGKISPMMKARRYGQVVDGRLMAVGGGMSLMDGWNRYVLGINPWLTDATARGIPVNEVERENVRVWLTDRKEDLYKQIQLITPIEIRNLKPRREVK